MGFVRGELALVAGLQLAVGDAADADPVEQVAGDAALAVVLHVDDVLGCAGAGGQQQEAEGEAGHGWLTFSK